jgi:hypothetical protein
MKLRQKYLFFLVSKAKAPSSSTLSQACYDIKSVLEKALILLLATLQFNTFSLSIDLWTDNSPYKTPYINVNIHFIDQDWECHHYLLATCFLGRPHTGERVQAIVKEILVKFGLLQKVFWLVGDKGSNIMSASRLLKVGKIDCVLHTVHNIIKTDLIGHTEMKPIRDVLAIIKLVQRHFRYRGGELKKRFRVQEILKNLNQYFVDLDIWGILKT